MKGLLQPFLWGLLQKVTPKVSVWGNPINLKMLVAEGTVQN